VNKELVIADTNIFIDFYGLELIDQLFQLSFQIHTPHEVLMELSEHERKTFLEKESKGLLHILPGREPNDDLEFSKRLSTTDISVLTYAFELECITLTGEKKMVSWCNKHSLESHGIIWVFEMLIEEEIISSEQAAQYLENLMTINTWLPVEICTAKINSWQKN